MKLTVSPVESGQPDDVVFLADAWRASDGWQLYAAQDVPGSSPAPQWVKGHGGVLTAAGGSVTTIGATTTSGHQTFAVAPQSEVRLEGFGLDVRLKVGEAPSVAIEG
jgi:hypothetical protein